jgi:2-polyprenyl-3-methyl-5-hydroxy-6-metoxy-1,4-benzoquinol methylase
LVAGDTASPCWSEILGAGNAFAERGQGDTEEVMDPRTHWQKVYETKKPTEVSWYQPTASLSLSLIRRAASDHATAIIDVGGGASTLVDGLLAAGYSKVTVLDVSRAALTAAAARLAEKAEQVTWLEANVLDVELPGGAVDVWHDRAVFHFLTDIADRQRYVEQVRASVRIGGSAIVATFASDGPTRCSGLDVARYSPQELHRQFGSNFQLVESAREEHRTPAGVVQSFIYCWFRVTNGRTRV